MAQEFRADSPLALYTVFLITHNYSCQCFNVLFDCALSISDRKRALDQLICYVSG